ncbi:MAG: DUF3422 domain-containing protein [Paracoccaceae bacterium]
MPPIQDHPLRYALANELHARPFPSMAAPCTAVFLAVKQPTDAANRDRSQDLAHLMALLDRHGAPHPQPGATHYFGEIGRHTLKWEQHTEFVTYTVIIDGVSKRPFDPTEFEVFPEDWLEQAPGQRVTSAMIRIDLRPDDIAISRHLSDWFVPESVAVASVVDDEAIVAGDFRIDPAGHQRFAVFVAPDVSDRRVGRVVQRLCEIEIYKSMSMFGFSRARTLSPLLGELDSNLTNLMGDMSQQTSPAEQTLSELLAISAELETLAAQSSFRFGATGAYETIVNQRIEVLREARFMGRQTLGEFMLRRFAPAMRTVSSAERQLEAMADRSIRAGNLLRTRVDVDRSAQNQLVLESMDNRADMQLRLQRTVEGLSVVAISYYAVSLAAYLLYPLAGAMGLGKNELTAYATLPVIAVVWYLIRRIRARME